MTRAVVTGGAGFIGSALVDTLVAQNYHVTVLDDFSHGKKENLAQSRDSIHVIDGSIVDLGAVETALSDADIVFHLAANRSVPHSVFNPLHFNRVNIDGTVNILETAKNVGIKRVVFSGSSAAYGDNTSFPQTESLMPNPQSPYAIQKVTGEHLMRYYWDSFDLETVSLRYFNVFGPRDDATSSYGAVIQIFIDRILSGKPIIIDGTGEQSRDFIFVQDVADANIAAATRARKDAFGVPINVCTGKSVTVNQLLETVQNLTGKKVPFSYGPSRAGDVVKTLGDNARARELLGFEPSWSFEAGLQKTIPWVQNQLSILHRQ